MSPQERALVVHNMTLNPKGGVGNCVEPDYFVELTIKKLRDIIPQAGADVESMNSLAKSLGMKTRCEDSLERAVGAPLRSTAHTDADMTRDVHLVRDHALAHWMKEDVVATSSTVAARPAKKARGRGKQPVAASTPSKAVRPTGPVFAGMLAAARERIDALLTPEPHLTPPLRYEPMETGGEGEGEEEEAAAEEEEEESDEAGEVAEDEEYLGELCAAAEKRCADGDDDGEIMVLLRGDVIDEDE
jgi:hypothetical protein